MKSKKDAKKRKTKRSAEKYPALRQDLNLKTRFDLVDYDYLDKLNDKELEWLNKFTEEYTHTDFRHTKPIMKTKKERREAYARNNARNRCVFTRAKASGNLMYFSEIDAKKGKKSKRRASVCLLRRLGSVQRSLRASRRPRPSGSCS